MKVCITVMHNRIMPRITVTISDALDEHLEEQSGDGEEFGSKSEVMRHLAEHGREAAELRDRVDELESELADAREQRDELQERADRVEDLETELERVKNEKRLLLEQREEKKELVRYVERERDVEERWRKAGVLTKTKWKLFGMPDEDSSTA
jgi:Arc/MetJ-type ribon-helix-helix transcriptional regulator